MRWRGNKHARARSLRDSSLAMERDLARYGCAKARKGNHDDSPKISSEKVVVGGQGKQGAAHEE